MLAHQDVIELLLDEESAALAELEIAIGKPIRLQAEALYAAGPIRRRADIDKERRRAAWQGLASSEETVALGGGRGGCARAAAALGLGVFRLAIELLPGYQQRIADQMRAATGLRLDSIR